MYVFIVTPCSAGIGHTGVLIAMETAVCCWLYLFIDTVQYGCCLM